MIKTFDRFIFLFIHPQAPNAFSYIMLFITILVNGLMVFLIISLFHQKRKQYFLPSVLSLIAVGIIISLLKQYFAYTRPVHHFSPEEITVIGKNLMNYSFPSGHAGAALVLTFFVIGSSKNMAFIALSLLAGGTAALSRVVIGIHFPSDVWAGGWIGYWTSKFIFYFFERNDSLSRIKDLKWNSAIMFIMGICCVVIYLFFYPAKNTLMDPFINPLLYITFLILIYLLIKEVQSAYNNNNLKKEIKSNG